MKGMDDVLSSITTERAADLLPHQVNELVS
jgi:hypothetical protein